MNTLSALSLALVLSSSAVSAEGYDYAAWVDELDSSDAQTRDRAEGWTLGVLMGMDADIRARNEAGGFTDNVMCLPVGLDPAGVVKVLRPMIAANETWRTYQTTVALFLAAKALWPAPCRSTNL